MIAITSGNYDAILRAHDKANVFDLDPTGIHNSLCEGWYSFFIPTFGGKEDWPTTDERISLHHEFMEWLVEHTKTLDFVELAYGGDLGLNPVVSAFS